MKNDILVIALGGNAIISSNENVTYSNIIKNLRKTVRSIVPILKKNKAVITFGNGPEIGILVRQNENTKDAEPMPLNVLGAESQGLIGYLLEEQLLNELRRKKVNKPVVTIMTQVLINKYDVAFKKPTKPIGSFYSLKEAGKLVGKGYDLIEDSGRGYRRVVPSPKPIRIVEELVIKKLVKDFIVIAVGGGGVPVVMRRGKLNGVEGVIDKDLASAVLSKNINAKVLLILTGVDHVSLNYGKMDQRDLKRLTLEEAKKYLKEGHFPKGSMGPKIEAAIDFLRNGGKEAIITSPSKAEQALKGKVGTLIVRR